MSVSIRGPVGEFAIGTGNRTRVMALVGTTRMGDYPGQRQKLDVLAALGAEAPDVVADLSLVPASAGDRLWERARALGFATATLPIYWVKPRFGKIDHRELLDVATEQLESGVSMVTIHPTATPEMVRASARRLVPYTSRGGGLVIRDLAVTGRSQNVYTMVMADLIALAFRHGAVISIGASFRSANIFDSMDQVQCAEIRAQLELADCISRSGVGVIIEGPGHATPATIEAFAASVVPSGYPVMPLGPLPTDIAMEMDHVAAAIGATLLGLRGAAHLLAAVTRQEHLGGIPDVASTVEAVRAARVAAHVVDIALLADVDADVAVSRERARSETCVVGASTAGCSRCGRACPLISR